MKRFEQVQPGKLSAIEYDSAVGDLVAYLQWMGEPAQNTRVRIGVWVVLFLLGLMFIAWRLNASFWKDSDQQLPSRLISYLSSELSVII